MPTELSRTTARKRIPVGTSFVDVPVITKISFVDPNDRHQETQYTIDNSFEAARLVHTDTIGSVHVPVERIDRWSMLDGNDRGQETQMTMDNVTGHDSVPPHFSAHLKTHVVRYKNPADSSVHIDSELIDQFAVLDPNDRGQETVFVLNNPAIDDDAQADPNDPDVTDSGNGIDPAWRTDPFQNLIDITGGGALVEQHFVFRRWGPNCGAANLAVEQSTVSEDAGGDWYPVDAEWVAAKRALGQTWPGFFETGGVRHLLSDLINAFILLSHQYGQTPGGNDGQFGRNPWQRWIGYSGLGYQECYTAQGPPFIGPPVAQPSTGNRNNHFYTILVGYAEVDDVGTGGPTIPPGRPPWVPP